MARIQTVCLLLVVAALAGAGCRQSTAPVAGTQADDLTQRRAIAALLANQKTAWNRGDVAGYMDGYWRSDSLVFIDSKGPAYGWQQNLAIYQRVYPNPAAMGTLAYSGLRVTLLAPTVAQVVGNWRLTHPKAGDEHGHLLLVLRQINSRWVVVADHSSSL